MSAGSEPEAMKSVGGLNHGVIGNQLIVIPEKPPRITGRYASIVSRMMPAAPAKIDFHDFAVAAPVGWDMLGTVWSVDSKDKSVEARRGSIVVRR